MPRANSGIPRQMCEEKRDQEDEPVKIDDLGEVLDKLMNKDGDGEPEPDDSEEE